MAKEYPLPLVDFLANPGSNVQPGYYPQPAPDQYGVGTPYDPSMPIGVGRTENVLPYNPQQNQIQQNQIQENLGFQRKALPVTAGLAAGSRVTATPRAEDAILQTAGAGAAGAATGAVYGGVPGAVVGGLVGLVTGGIQAFTGLRSARDQRRSQERDIAEVRRREDERFEYEKALKAQDRSDTQENIRYNRKQNALATQWTAFQNAIQLLNKGMAENKEMETLFIQRGR